MQFKITLTVFCCFLVFSSCHSQIIKNVSLPPLLENVIKDLTFEVGVNRSKVINTKKISFFAADNDIWSFVADIKKEFYPITTNYNLSLGYGISRRHHIRLRYAKNELRSTLIGSVDYTGGSTTSISPPVLLNRRDGLIISKSIGLIYEYHIPYYDGNFIAGTGIEKQKNRPQNEVFVIPGIQSRSFSIHAHFGYLTALNEVIELHGKIFSTYYFANNEQFYENPVSSKFVPIQIGVEIAFRFNFKNAFPNSKNNKNKNRKRRKKWYFIKPY